MNITLREALAKLDTKVVKSEDPNRWEFAAALGLPTNVSWDPEFEKHLRAYPIRVWMCTDTMVGIYAYFLDGEVVAVSYQSERKGTKRIRFTSVEASVKVYRLLRSLSTDWDDIVHMTSAIPNYAPSPRSLHYFSII